MERLRHCVIDHGSSSWLQCEVSKYSYTFGDPKYRSAPMIVPPMVEGLWVFETVVFVCFSTCVLWPLKTATWVLRFIKVRKPWGVQLYFQLLTALAKVSQLKRVSQISSLSEAVVTHLLYNYLVSTPINHAMLFTLFGCTHPPPPVLPFLLTQNLSPRTLPEVTSWSWKSHDGYIRYKL